MNDNTRVLIVDDDWLNVEVMEAYLSGEGYIIDSAPSGEKALERVRTQPPDVILLDVRMSGMSGFEVAQQLKGNPATQHIPVLLVTAYNAKSDVEQALESGVDDMLFKPINAPLMLMRVRTLARLKRLYDQLDA